MNFEIFLLCAAALAIERVAYIAAWRRPDEFARLCAQLHVADEPTRALERLFYAFKAIQGGVFLGWVLAAGGPSTASPGPVVLALAALLAGVGQALNFSVFWRLGRVGVFYGVRFGRQVPWVEGFPFSLTAHPQYLGTVLTIWAWFLATRFPHPDWAVLPLLESVYYALGSHLEQMQADDADAGEQAGDGVEAAAEPYR